MVERKRRIKITYLVNLPWACGAIITNNKNIIIHTAPIFKKYLYMSFLKFIQQFNFQFEIYSIKEDK